MIPFSPPKVYPELFDEILDSLQSGWITTGPKTKKFEENLAAYAGVPNVLCTNAATSGLELMLRWWGVKPGDEVILPAYTYCATANVILHCGAKPVMVDIGDDFNIDPEKIKGAITPATKVILPVDIGGWPCDYDAIKAIVDDPAIIDMFRPSNDKQEQLGRIMILGDAAHSLGATYKGKRSGSLADVTVFSFHAVKNLTTGEGGAICLNLPKPFDNAEIYAYLRVKSLHGQTKDALAKTQKGNWEYDVIEPGYKFNMPDLLAALGLVELARYESETLPRRKEIFERYESAFRQEAWAELPVWQSGEARSSLHLYLLRIKDIDELQRNRIITEIFNRDVSVNVHFKPLPLLTAYKTMGYRMSDYPNAYRQFSREISLPVYYDLEDEAVDAVIQAVIHAVNIVK